MSWAETLIDAGPEGAVEVSRDAMQFYGDKFSGMANKVPFEDIPFLLAAVQIHIKAICAGNPDIYGAVKELEKCIFAEMITFLDRDQKEDA